MPLALPWAARPMRLHRRRLLQRPGRWLALAPPAAARGLVARERAGRPGLRALGEAPTPLEAREPRERPALAPAQRCRSAALPVRQALQASPGLQALPGHEQQ